ncbi:MAG: ABC transporter permease [Acetobacteraceae bacterium]|jgi:peptide/nickel transport system permease protein|nr:ABC transporter permease [Acetobacteraceae bacterium]
MTAGLARFWQSDLAFEFRRSPAAIAAALVLLLFLAAAVAPDLLAPVPVFDLTRIALRDAFLPPVWMEGGSPAFLLGTDAQGRDVLSAIIYGARVSMLVGVASVLLSVLIGVPAGLVAGYGGGWVDALIMRAADIQLTFPAILVAVIFDGMARAALGGVAHERLAVPLLILAIGITGWVQYARTVRGATLVERGRDYVAAAALIGRRPAMIMLGHILPNVLTPVLVLATINLAVAIILEATLSFVGLGIPPTQPSLGTLIRVGNDYLLSGEWWIVIFPGLALLLLVLAVNLLGDWLRDALNPALQ